MSKSIVAILVLAVIITLSSFLFFSGGGTVCEFNSTFDCLQFGVSYFANGTESEGYILLYLNNMGDEEILLSGCRAFVDDHPFCINHRNISSFSPLHPEENYENSLYCVAHRWEPGEQKYLRLDSCEVSDFDMLDGETHEIRLELDYFKVADIGEDYADNLSEGSRPEVHTHIFHSIEDNNVLETDINETLYTSHGKVMAKLVPER